MIQNCALYFPDKKIPIEDIIPDGSYTGGLFSKRSKFTFDCGDGSVTLNLSSKNLDQHLNGFMAYVSKLNNNSDTIYEAKKMISRTAVLAGVSLIEPISPDSKTFSVLMECINRYNGFMFVADSILLPNGTFMVGPQADLDTSSGAENIPVIEIDPDEFRHKGPSSPEDNEKLKVREENYCHLAERGFSCTLSLPLFRTDDKADSLRPLTEIAQQCLAFTSLFLWVASDPSVVNSDDLKNFMEVNDLYKALSQEEQEIFQLERIDANQKFAETIGWKLENIWTLSWILGFDPKPDFWIGQIDDSITDRLIMEFFPPLNTTLSEFMKEVSVRETSEIAQLEDLYYCAHNAVRSAQLGESTVPSSFHPVIAGGATHERRHVLTWALSPNTAWKDTDLST